MHFGKTHFSVYQNFAAKQLLGNYTRFFFALFLDIVRWCDIIKHMIRFPRRVS
jgi:hypothetical protein